MSISMKIGDFGEIGRKSSVHSRRLCRPFRLSEKIQNFPCESFTLLCLPLAIALVIYEHCIDFYFKNIHLYLRLIFALFFCRQNRRSVNTKSTWTATKIAWLSVAWHFAKFIFGRLTIFCFMDSWNDLQWYGTTWGVVAQAIDHGLLIIELSHKQNKSFFVVHGPRVWSVNTNSCDTHTQNALCLDDRPPVSTDRDSTKKNAWWWCDKNTRQWPVSGPIWVKWMSSHGFPSTWAEHFRQTRWAFSPNAVIFSCT